ncbi:NPC intracellular cholesterol transporter 2 [Teleopsis dalmanni]|uniref:NPC intracellular cholesterol transporter 2 n=1 Tax=Teleopsis dalmanni TaxID=139649 RepID=UPI0018CDA9DE|nr:NPC intracellular cholesterol transporter 2 [Teleopsis dalmanni]
MLPVKIALLIFCFTIVTATTVKQCKKGQPFPLNVTINDCEEPPCNIVKGTTAIMDMHFVSTKDNIRKLTAKVSATTLGLTVPYDLPEEVSDVCSNLLYGAICPIDETEDVVYRLNFYIDYLYPEISVKVEVSLMDEDNESVACFNVDIKVKKGASAALIE